MTREEHSLHASNVGFDVIHLLWRNISEFSRVIESFPHRFRKILNIATQIHDRFCARGTAFGLVLDLKGGPRQVFVFRVDQIFKGL